ncbi:hypothetical protein B9Z55_008481 [Caenorhabditis nigoni]|uniref:Uncharacterized protein n=1 Tax=Caenorhabditis nigoni TaxID=1611254 RepID=A0A2G5UMU5_9PELO|nr:hypothetical protein B9Z55_008481 [Caenorhabditis nigoni]
MGEASDVAEESGLLGSCHADFYFYTIAGFQSVEDWIGGHLEVTVMERMLSGCGAYGKENGRLKKKKNRENRKKIGKRKNGLIRPFQRCQG